MFHFYSEALRNHKGTEQESTTTTTERGIHNVVPRQTTCTYTILKLNQVFSHIIKCVNVSCHLLNKHHIQDSTMLF